ncbi:DUF6221 family protein [Streptomyces sp. NPDC003314]
MTEEKGTGPAPTGAYELDAMVEYLREQWALERAAAKGFESGGYWTGPEGTSRGEIRDEKDRTIAIVPPDSPGAVEHIVMQDPHEVLADLAAKEALLGFLRPTELYGHAVRILLQRYAKYGDFPPAWHLPASITENHIA